MLFTVIFIVVISLFINNSYQKHSFKELYYRISFSKKMVECGENFEIFLIVENKKLLPLTFLQINQEYPKDLKFNLSNNLNGLFKTAFSLLPYQRIKRSIKINCSKRGRYILSNAEVICGDLLGFKSFTKSYEVMDEVVVLPKPYDLRRKLKPFGSFIGDISVKRWIIEDPILTIGIRQYTGNEPLKYIHWPSSLKNQELMVKEFDFTTDNNVLIALNIETCKPFWSNIDADKIERAISTVRTIVDELESIKIPYGLMSNSQNFAKTNLESPALGNRHYQKILESLGIIDYNISLAFEDLLSQYKAQKYTTLIIVTPYILDAYVNGINKLTYMFQKVVLISIDPNNIDKINSNIEIYYEGND